MVKREANLYLRTLYFYIHLKLCPARTPCIHKYKGAKKVFLIWPLLALSFPIPAEQSRFRRQSRHPVSTDLFVYFSRLFLPQSALLCTTNQERNKKKNLLKVDLYMRGSTCYFCSFWGGVYV